MSGSHQARPYQDEAFSLISGAYQKGHRKVLLWLATGGGKTFVFCEIAKRTVAKPKLDGSKRRVAVVVRGRKLVDQASKRLFHEGTPHGVYMAGHWNYRPNELIQVCSIDTLRARNIVLDVDLLIIDEAHLFTSDGDKEYLAKYKCFILSVTATPYCKEGLRHVADVMVKPTSMLELIEQRHLVPFKYFAPSEPNLEGVKVNNASGEYVNDQLDDAMFSSGELAGKIVETWLEIGQNLATVVFTTNIARSKKIAQLFRDAGITAEHMDADTPESERVEILKRHEDGITKVICNVGILCTGVDMPWLRIVSLARAVNSLNLFVQQAGRLTRNFFGKTHGILIDHGGNIRRHGLPTDEPDVDLDGKIKESAEKLSRKCKLCFGVFRGPHCPDCGPQEREGTITDMIIETQHKIVELEIEIDPVKRRHQELLKEAKKTNKRPTWASYKLIDTFGLERSKPYLTAAFIERYENGVSNAFGNSRFRAIGTGQ